MNKPYNFECKIYTERVGVGKTKAEEERFEAYYTIPEQFGFNSDSDCGQQFYIGRDIIYENLISRTIFLLKRLKEEKFIVKSYEITATIFNSKVHGELI